VVDTETAIEAFKSGQLGELRYRRLRTGGQSLLQGPVEHSDPRRRNPARVPLPNVILTGHQAFFTREAPRTILDTTLANISDFAAGRPLANKFRR